MQQEDNRACRERLRPQDWTHWECRRWEARDQQPMCAVLLTSMEFARPVQNCVPLTQLQQLLSHQPRKGPCGDDVWAACRSVSKRIGFKETKDSGGWKDDGLRTTIKCEVSRQLLCLFLSDLCNAIYTRIYIANLKKFANGLLWFSTASVWLGPGRIDFILVRRPSHYRGR